ncbi:acetyl-CoA carboxylase biotin carboxyl carrier protein [Nonomuraea sp. NPDC050790]|uniref:acetyl-CoA carboxylase biotin carboxyl carrier protein n=1 Tax=Nonomuraea sp. NPDC050790 TaxID=3364371 RepID=UPI0037916A75
MTELPNDSDFDTLCEAATRLVSLLPHPPATLKISHGLASAELTWSDGFPAVVTTTVDAPLPDDGHIQVRAPLVGTFYRAPEPGAAPYVSVGDTVEVGQQIGIVESMKLMNPIVAEAPGRVVDIPVADAAPVEYDQPLVVIAPGDSSACDTLFPGSR